MEKIASFTVDHDKLKKGMYISRIDGDIITYDIRMKVPNAGDYLTDKELHTIEHLFATFARNSTVKDGIIYVGPMGCRTGFYLLTRDTIPQKEAIELSQEAFKFIKNFEGIIPGSVRKECGNYLEHDLEAAKKSAADMIEVLKDYKPEMLSYDYER